MLGRPSEALPFLDLCADSADEQQRSHALAIREECIESAPAKLHSPATPPHLGGHCNVSHIDEGVLDYLIDKFQIRSILDIGCGPGGMVRLAKAKGLRALGVDGDPQVRELSGLGSTDLIIHDFTKGPLHLEERFDLVWSVEFLEHVEERFQENYMPLFRQGKYVFSTAAPPGKPGTHHVNCREVDYWREVFRRHHLLYDHHTAETLRSVSTMPREFVRETGMFFLLDEEGPQEQFTLQIPGQSEILEAAVSVLEPGNRVLDLGAGRCEASRRFAEAGCTVTAVGMHFDRYLNGPVRAELEALGVSLHESSIEAYTSSERFDALWAAHILEHQRNPGWFLERCLDLVQPGGWLLLSVPPGKTQVVSGHVTVWFPGLLLYNLVLCGLDCRNIHMRKIGYNIVAFVRNIRLPLPPLSSSLGDIELLADRFPEGLGRQGFEGEFDQLNWPPGKPTAFSE